MGTQYKVPLGTNDDESSSHNSESNDEMEWTVGSSAATSDNPKSNEDGSVCEVELMDSKASKKVWFWKVVTLLSLVTTATLVSVGSYVLLIEKENEVYENAYLQMVGTITDASQFHASNILNSLNAFSDTITATASAQNETFPFVTIPSFEALASIVRFTTGAEVINWHVQVETDQLEDWRQYTSDNFKIHQEMQRAMVLALNASTVTSGEFLDGDILPYPYIPTFGEDGRPNPALPVFAPAYGEGPYFPAWMVSPPPFTPSFINSDPFPWVFKSEIAAVIEKRQLLFTDYTPIGNLASRSIKFEDHEAYHKTLVEYEHEEGESAFDHPHPAVMLPVFEKLNDPSSRLVGVFAVVLPWDKFLTNLLPDNVDGITCVVRSSCGRASTYALDGKSAFYMGEGDFHDPAYDDTEVVIPFGHYNDDSYEPLAGECTYRYHIFGTAEFEAIYRHELPWFLTAVVAIAFAFVIATFAVYDIFVNERNQQAVGAATKTSAIVTSLFPEQVRDRLMANEAKAKSKNWKVDPHSDAKGSTVDDSPPIADLYPECTVCYADITGFTAWSSTRQPTEVFHLLETLYREFDKIASRRSVFKVETVADSYLCCTGLPRPQKTHASIMVRFCAEVRKRVHAMGPELDLKLGPGTSSLKLRLGIHSGPVTAGVLRGQKERFQLFGDTVNTAARLESTAPAGRIHISSKTAEQLAKEGKAHWVTERKEEQTLKGKGTFKTFFAEPTRGAGSVASSEGFRFTTPELDDAERAKEFEGGLIDWMTGLMEDILKELVRHRRLLGKSTKRTAGAKTFDLSVHQADGMVRNEVLDSIELSKCRGVVSANTSLSISEDVALDPVVSNQLRAYIAEIAAGYNSNSFHNFDHACHVALSSRKLLQRVLSAADEATSMDPSLQEDVLDHGKGIRSDPLTQFAITFSALVHDLDHPGVANGQLVKEKSDLALRYDNLSVAEQNSVNLALNLLMEKRFNKLRHCICPDADEYRRFRQVVVNAVVTTDIFDKELKEAREQRWERTYGNAAQLSQEIKDDVIARKETIVIELVIQASDVSHTMQHWHVYQKWNHRLLLEQYAAFKSGRLEKNPLDGWVGGELWFYDNYIIPLATKMRDCKVFGVSCDEFLQYATDNRLEWANKGKEIVAQWAETIEEDYQKNITAADSSQETQLAKPVGVECALADASRSVRGQGFVDVAEC